MQKLCYLKPFWRFYGGKWRAAPRYPAPLHPTIVEPFAGSAGYAMRYYDRNVILADLDPVIAGIWRYLVAVRASEIRRIPEVDHVNDLPRWVPQEARWLVGFAMNDACTAPCRRLSAGRKKLRAMGRIYEGWSEAHRERVAQQVEFIRHWVVKEGSYDSLRNRKATWFVDPPYNNRAGSYYVYADVEYRDLARWCQGRRGQIIVCENEGAAWLPFKPFAVLKAGVNGKGSKEVIWYREE